MKIGRYRIFWGFSFWFQSGMAVPIRVWHFWLFWLVRTALPTDIDEKQRFPLGTKLEFEGRRYYYYKAGANIKVSEAVKWNDK